MYQGLEPQTTWSISGVCSWLQILLLCRGCNMTEPWPKVVFEQSTLFHEISWPTTWTIPIIIRIMHLTLPIAFCYQVRWYLEQFNRSARMEMSRILLTLAWCHIRLRLCGVWAVVRINDINCSTTTSFESLIVAWFKVYSIIHSLNLKREIKKKALDKIQTHDL